VIIFAADTGRLLLLRRSASVPSPHVWALPGGNVEEGETPPAAASIETWEETGYKDLEVADFPVHIWNSPTKPFTYFTFLACIPSEYIPKLNEEHSDYQWVFPEEALEKIDIHPNVADAIQSL